MNRRGLVWYNKDIMPRGSSKKEERERLVLTIAIGVAVALLLILGIRFVLLYAPDAMRAVLAWLIGLLPKVAVMPPATPAASSTVAASTPDAASVLSIAPAAPAPDSSSSLSLATYTELFSGVGYDDAANTTAYEDYVATAISLVPDFSVTPTTAQFTPATVDPAGVPPSENLGGSTVTQGADGVYAAHVPAFPNLVVTSTYQGILRFGYDAATRRTLVVYAAYRSRVLEVAQDGTVLADYSPRFDARAFGGGDDGSLAVHPVIFAHDGAWWIFSGEGSGEPKLIKIIEGGGAVIDYTTLAFPNEPSLAAAPGPSPHEIYVKGGSASYLLTDNGFKQSAVQWVSSKLNEWDGNVAMGEIASVDDSGAAIAPAPSYFLSNDGGATWIAATPGAAVNFPAPGGNLRFKVVISPASDGDQYATPWVGTVLLQYGVDRSSLP